MVRREKMVMGRKTAGLQFVVLRKLLLFFGDLIIVAY